MECIISEDFNYKKPEVGVEMVFRKEIRVICFLFVIVSYYLLANYTLNIPVNKKLMDVFFWVSLAAIIYSFGKVRANSKIKFKKYYVIWMAVAGTLYILIYFSSGFIDGFGRTLFDNSPKGIIQNILFLGSVIALKELVRFYLINSVQKKFSMYFAIAIIIVYSLLEINLVTAFQQTSIEGIISYTCSSVLPVIAHHAFLTLIAYLAGLAPALIYALMVKVPLWILPVLPNSKWITLLFVGTFIPIAGMIFLSNNHKSKSRRGKKRKEEEENPFGLLAAATLVIIMVWFSLRIFPLYPTVIASNSMYPEMRRGDMVVLLKEDYNDLEINDIIEYQLEHIRVVHRIIDIEYIEGEIYLVTQGDANQIQDASMVSRQQYLGSVKTVIPYIGYPTLLFSMDPEQNLVETGDS